MLDNVYYQQDDKTYYLKLDGTLRLIPNTQTFKNLYAQDFNVNLIPPSNQFPNQAAAPLTKGNPIINSATVYKIPNDQSLYFTDNFVWDLQKLVLRKIVNKSQFIKLGFVNTGTSWTGTLPEIAVPLAINSSNNMDLQTKVSGGYLVYQFICFGGDLNKYFISWVKQGKTSIKSMIINAQNAINKLNGVINVATPTFNPTYVTPYERNIIVTISCATPNTVIYYTTDGSQPLVGISSIYKNGVAIDVKSTNKVLKAVAEAIDSPGVSATNSVDYVSGLYPVSVPYPSVPSGNSGLNQIKVRLYCATPNVTIYYTTNGLTPTKQDSVYNGTPISLDLRTSNQKLKAFAFSSQYETSSAVMSAEYRFVPVKLSAPRFSLFSRSFAIPNFALTIYSYDPDAFVRYTTASDGIPSILFEAPINVNIAAAKDRTVKVSAQATGTYGQLPSDIVSTTYSCELDWKNCWRLAGDCNDNIGTVNFNNQNVVFKSEYSGNYAYFNGSALLSTTNVSTLQSPTFTISAWAKIEPITNVDNYVPIVTFEKSDNGHDGPGIVLFGNNYVQGQTIQSDGTYKIIKNLVQNFRPGQYFNHYVLTADGKTMTLYVNTVAIGSISYNGTINTNYCQRLCIGGEKNGTAPTSPILHPLTGAVRNVCYTNFALTKEQVYFLHTDQLLYGY